MENASKALLIAGGFLITILFLSLVSYLFAFMRGYSTSKIEQIEASKANEFNQQFLNYAGRDDLTIQDVITIVNLAKDNNKSEVRPTNVKVWVSPKFGGAKDWTLYTEEDLMFIIKNKLYSTESEEYICSNDGIIIDPDTLLVKSVNISVKK